MINFFLRKFLIFVKANFRVLDPRGSNHFQRQCIIQNYSYIIFFFYFLTKQQFCRLRFFFYLQSTTGTTNNTWVGAGFSFCLYLKVLNSERFTWTRKTRWKLRSNLKLFLLPNTIPLSKLYIFLLLETQFYVVLLPWLLCYVRLFLLTIIWILKF